MTEPREHNLNVKWDGMLCRKCNDGRIIYIGIVNGKAQFICSKCKIRWVQKRGMLC